MSTQNVLNSRHVLEFKKNKRRKLIKRVLVFFVVLFILFIVFIFFTTRKSTTIKNINVVGNDILTGEEIEQEVWAVLDGKFIWIIPKSNFIVYPRKKIQNHLLTQHKRIESISINDLDPETIEIRITERKPAYIWCGATIPIKTEEKCYFLDGSGYIFDESAYFSEGVYFKFFGEIKGDTPGSYFQEKLFEQLLAIKDGISGAGLNPTSIFVKNSGEIEVYLTSDRDLLEASKIILDAKQDVNETISNLSSAVKTEPLKEAIDKNYQNLEYIDLRFDNKVYYKFN